MRHVPAATQSGSRRLDPVTDRIAGFVADALRCPLPPEVLEKTRNHVIDSVAAIVSGSRLPAGTAALTYVQTLGGLPQATVIGSRHRTNVVLAAMANAMAGHGDETDDFHVASVTHPGCVVVPAALALCEARGLSGDAFMKAVTVGYEIGCRIPVAVDAYHQFKSGRGTHALGGMFGATATSAALLGFSPIKVAHALSFTTQQASGLTCWRRDEAHIEKAFDFAGMAARNGVMSATMVASGMPGVDDALTGVNGLFQVNAPPGHDWSAVWQDLGTRWEVIESSIKKWSVGSPGQAALDAVTALIRDHGIQPDEVRQIDIVIPDEVSHIVDEAGAPNVNIRHLVAVYLIDRALGFASTHDEARWTDERVAALRGKARVVPSPELTVARPRRQAIVEITRTDGSVIRHHARVVRGTPEDPMSREEVLDKARDLVMPVLGREQGAELLEALLAIETRPDCGRLVQLLTTENKDIDREDNDHASDHSRLREQRAS
jgi:2-methylcitrate dehydratase PrpD